MLSVVIPVYNEEEVIEVFYKELSKHLPKRDTEMIFVDDGSIDNTPSLLKKLAEENSNIRIFSFRKHRGKSEALTLGFKKASGDMILTIDADLQDRPDQIGKLIEKSKEGWDLISGWRKNRKDSFFKKISSKVFNLISSIFWGLKVNDLNSGLKLYTKDAAKSLNLYGGILFILGFIILAYLSYLRFLGERIGDRPLLLFGVLLVLTGLQVFFIGFIADLILHLSKKDDIDSKL